MKHVCGNEKLLPGDVGPVEELERLVDKQLDKVAKVEGDAFRVAGGAG